MILGVLSILFNHLQFLSNNYNPRHCNSIKWKLKEINLDQRFFILLQNINNYVMIKVVERWKTIIICHSFNVMALPINQTTVALLKDTEVTIYNTSY